MFDRPLAMSLDGQVLSLTGSVDEYSVAALRERLTELVDVAPHLVVDVSGIDFLPSAGIGVLVRVGVAFRGAGGSLTIVAADGTPAQHTLALTGLPYVTEVSGEGPHGAASV